MQQEQQRNGALKRYLGEHAQEMQRAGQVQQLRALGDVARQQEPKPEPERVQSNHGEMMTLHTPSRRCYAIAWHKVASFDDLVRILRAMQFIFHAPEEHKQLNRNEQLGPIAHLLVEVKP